MKNITDTKKFKFLEHTADVKFQAFGKSVDELFKNSALAMFNGMYDGKVKKTRKIKVKAKGKDFESLLYNFLEELLVLFDGNHFFLSEVKKLEISKDISDKGNVINKKRMGRAKKSEPVSDKSGRLKLEAEVMGDKARNYEIHIDIKAITYNDMFVKRQGKTWMCQVVLDV